MLKTFIFHDKIKTKVDKSGVNTVNAALLELPQTIPPLVQYSLPEPLQVRRGEVWLADMSYGIGSEQTGLCRYVLCIQSDIGNRYSPTIIAATITSQVHKAKLPTHVEIPLGNGLPKPSLITLEQIRSIDKFRLIERVTKLDDTYMKQVDQALMISVGLFH